MWRLTIQQKKPNSEYFTENVVFESEEIAPLLIQVSNLSKLDTPGNTKYEICEVPKANCVKEGEEE